MDIDIKLDSLNYDELFEIHTSVKNFISYLNDQIETREVEKRKNEWNSSKEIK